MRTLAAGTMLLMVQRLIAQEATEFPLPPQVELHGARQLPDGFRVEVECAAFPPKQRKDVPLLGFTLRVPRRVGRTSVGIVFAEIQGRSGESRFFVVVDHRTHGDKEQYLVTADHRLTQSCVVHFEYKTSDGVVVKNYIVRLKDYVVR